MENNIELEALSGQSGAYKAGTIMATVQNVDASHSQRVVVDAGSIAIENNGVLSVGNTRHTPLPGGGVFVGVGENVLDYSGIIVSVFADAYSLVDGIEFQFSPDGVDWRTSDHYTFTANDYKVYALQVVSAFFRVIYRNGSIAQSTLFLCTQYKKFGGVNRSHRIQDLISGQDDADLTKAVLSAERQGTPGKYANVQADAGGNLNVSIGGISQDAGARVRVSQLTTLGDYKILNRDRPLLWENAGTGTGLFVGNKYSMSVTAGQWLVRQTRRVHQYFSGKSQVIELTFDGFAPQAGVQKRAAYFRSNSVSPFASAYDGFWLESADGTITLKASRSGTETLSIPFTQWTGYPELGEYRTLATWNTFTVIFFDFLWLGGAVLRLWIKTSAGFVLAHAFHYSGTAADVFILSPNQPVRYEIRSTGGAGAMRYICAQVSTEGSVGESGLSVGVDTGTTAITMPTVGVRYPLKAVRRGASFQDAVIELETFGVMMESNDRARYTLELNPVLSAPLTYIATPGYSVEHANGNGVITITTPGTILQTGYFSLGTPIDSNPLKTNFLSILGGSLTGVQDEIVLVITPLTPNINVFGAINMKEF